MCNNGRMRMARLDPALPGVSIIEVLIATVLVGMALTAMAALMAVSVKNSSEADYRKIAIRFAQDGIEQVRNRKETVNWTAFQDASQTEAACGTDSSVTRFAMKFQRVCALTNDAGDTTKSTITVRVCWASSSCAVNTINPTSVLLQQEFYKY